MGTKKISFHCLAVAAVATAVLAAASISFDMSRLHLGDPNDQVGYISVARNFVDTGDLRSSLVYPSILGQNKPRNHLYMPGHYLSLALSYAVFGFGVLPSWLPSLLAFVIASVATWLFAYRTLGIDRAWIAAVLFMAFPANVIYAFTAMAEMTIVAATTLSLLVFTALPERKRFWLAPFLLVVPFFFRETTAMLALPMAVFLVSQEGSLARRIGRGGAFGVLAVAVLSLAYSTDVSSGRGSLFAANFFAPSLGTLYTDAFPEIDTSWSRVPSAIGLKIRINFEYLIAIFSRVPPSYETASVGAFIVSAVAGLLLAVFGRGVRAPALASSGAILVVFGFIFMLYGLSDTRGLRMLLFTWPLACATWAAALYAIPGFRDVKAPLRALGFSFVLVLGLVVVRTEQARQAAFDPIYDENLAFLESLDHDDETLLISLWSMSFSYVYKHHPVKWSFVPANMETLELLAEHHSIGTMLIQRVGHGPPPPSRAIAFTGLEFKRPVSHHGRRFWLYQR